MYRPGQLFRREPAIIAAAVIAVANCAVLFGLDLTPDQVAGGNGALIAVLNLFYVRPQVAPTSEAPE